MRHVPVAEFKDSASAWIAAAEAGEEIVITRHGKPAVKLMAVAEDRKAAQRAAVDALFAAGRERRARGEPSVSSEEIIAWIKEDQR